MKTEIVKQRILTADEGKYLTNGDVIVQTVVQPESADASEWREIDESEKIAMERAAESNGI